MFPFGEKRLLPKKRGHRRLWDSKANPASPCPKDESSEARTQRSGGPPRSRSVGLKSCQEAMNHLPSHDQDPKESGRPVLMSCGLSRRGHGREGSKGEAGNGEQSLARGSEIERYRDIDRYR